VGRKEGRKEGRKKERERESLNKDAFVQQMSARGPSTLSPVISSPEPEVLVPVRCRRYVVASSTSALCFLPYTDFGGMPERGIKESGIISNFQQSGKGHKRKGAETERGQNGKWHEGKMHKGI
jgi:hypothetical protein